MFGDGSAGYVLFFYFNSALDAYRRPQRVSLIAESCRAAGQLLNGAFGQYRFGAPHKACVSIHINRNVET